MQLSPLFTGNVLKGVTKLHTSVLDFGPRVDWNVNIARLAPKRLGSYLKPDKVFRMRLKVETKVVVTKTANEAAAYAYNEVVVLCVLFPALERGNFTIA